MAEPIKAPYLPSHVLRKTADAFLAKYHPTRSIPVPIEEIVEFQMDIRVLSLPGLQDLLAEDSDGIVGFISSDLKVISVDQAVLLHRPGRYRFTLAHEAGHSILHREVYELATFTNADGWKKFVKTLPSEALGWIEWQANCFAGLVLVPSEHLEKKAVETFHEFMRQVDQKGIDLSDTGPVWEFVAERVSADFDVSPDVITRRLKFDKILERHDPTVKGSATSPKEESS